MFRIWRRKRGEKAVTPVKDLLPRDADIVDKNIHGILYIRDGRLGVIPFKPHSVWGELAPLFKSKKVEEIWLLPTVVVATVHGVGRVALEKKAPLEDIVVRLVAETGVRVDLRKPYNSTELDGWRISVQIEPAGQTEIVATRIKKVPELTDLVDPLLAARILLLLLRPSTVAIVGPPGSGKTTLLNSMLVKIAQLFPQLHLTLVERRREIVVSGGWVTRSVGKIGVLVGHAVRYKRPDVLFIGELASDDVWSFVETGKSGLPVAATYHSPNVMKAVKTMRDVLRLHIGEGDTLDYVDVFIQTGKTVTLEGVERKVEAVYVSDGQRLVPVFIENIHVPEEEFDKTLPKKLLVGETKNIKTVLYERLGVGSDNYVFEPLEPLLVS